MVTKTTACPRFVGRKIIMLMVLENNDKSKFEDKFFFFLKSENKDYIFGLTGVVLITEKKKKIS